VVPHGEYEIQGAPATLLNVVCRLVPTAVTAVMEGATTPAQALSVPLVVETGMARNWDEAHWAPGTTAIRRVHAGSR
jgi:hypothetical protein